MLKLIERHGQKLGGQSTRTKMAAGRSSQKFIPPSVVQELQARLDVREPAEQSSTAAFTRTTQLHENFEPPGVHRAVIEEAGFLTGTCSSTAQAAVDDAPGSPRKEGSTVGDQALKDDSDGLAGPCTPEKLPPKRTLSPKSTDDLGLANSHDNSREATQNLGLGIDGEALLSLQNIPESKILACVKLNDIVIRAMLS